MLQYYMNHISLQSLEHCIGDFLDNCDADNDLTISFNEWANCLELDGDEFEAKCQDLETEF